MSYTDSQIAKGGYFMTPQQEDAVIGRLVRELKEASDHLGKLRAEAKVMAEQFGRLGYALEKHAESVIFQGEPIPTQFASGQPPFQDSLFDAQKIRRLADDCRKTSMKIDSLREQLRNAGYPDNA